MRCFEFRDSLALFRTRARARIFTPPPSTSLLETTATLARDNGGSWPGWRSTRSVIRSVYLTFLSVCLADSPYFQKFSNYGIYFGIFWSSGHALPVLLYTSTQNGDLKGSRFPLRHFQHLPIQDSVRRRSQAGSTGSPRLAQW